MRLVLDPAEEAAHGEWLRGTPGAYEWWYFDALSGDGQWVLTCIWFLGNPFSPYYRQSALGQASNPSEENALFVALYRYGKLHAYHFTRFPLSEISSGETVPLCLHFGPNKLVMETETTWNLSLTDQNANGRQLTASITFTAPPLSAAAQEQTLLDSDHAWLPIAPFCRVLGTIELREPQNPGAEIIQFHGTGYHDHNWGRLPFDAAIRDWYWARAALGNECSVILYHVQPHRGPTVSHLLLFDQGRLLHHDNQAKVLLNKPVINGLGTKYCSQLTVTSIDLDVVFRFGKRLDSAPFYIRALCTADLHQHGKRESGQGIGEYLRPRAMSWPLVASAMKARIVER